MQITSLDQLPRQVGALNLSFQVKTPPAKIAEKRWDYNSGATRDGNRVNVELQNLENIHLYAVGQAERFVLAHLADPEDRHSVSKVLASWLLEAESDGLSLAECIYLDEYKLPRNGNYDEGTLHNLLKPTYAKILEKGLGVKSVRYGAMFMTPIASMWNGISCFRSHDVQVESDPDEYIHWLFRSEPREVSGTSVALVRSSKDLAYTIEGRYAEFDGQLLMNGNPLCVLNGRDTLRLGSGTLVSPMGTRMEIPGVSLLEFSPALKPF